MEPNFPQPDYRICGYTSSNEGDSGPEWFTLEIRVNGAFFFITCRLPISTILPIEWMSSTNTLHSSLLVQRSVNMVMKMRPWMKKTWMAVSSVTRTSRFPDASNGQYPQSYRS